jgi:formylmethanofuran dehydrogenase subunit C
MNDGEIAVKGNAGDRVGGEMCGDSIKVFGDAGHLLLATELGRLGFHIDQRLLDTELLLYHGDLVALGEGEVWMRANP